jgi:hypothetical protein
MHMHTYTHSMPPSAPPFTFHLRAWSNHNNCYMATEDHDTLPLTPHLKLDHRCALQARRERPSPDQRLPCHRTCAQSERLSMALHASESETPPGSPPQEQQPRRSSVSPGKRGAEASAHSSASCDAAEATGAGGGELLMPPRSWRARLQGRRGAGDEKRVKVVSVTRGDSTLLSFDDQVVPTGLVTKLN